MTEYISKEVARSYLDKACECIGGNGGAMLKLKFDEEPTADVRENVRGEWHHISSTGWECSACGRVVTMRPIDKKKTLYNFCPNCGAEMER